MPYKSSRCRDEHKSFRCGGEYITNLAGLDSGRGGAAVWTVGPLDRERRRQLSADIVVADAGGLSATHPITIVVDDINDNPMKPAAKTVYLWKPQVSSLSTSHKSCFHF